MRTKQRARGTGLIEALIAIAILGTALSTMAALASVALTTVRATRSRTLAVMHAHSKLVELSRAASGLSPGGTLDADDPGWSDRLDAAGRVVGGGASGVVYARRWEARPLAGAPGIVRIVVRVGTCGAAGPPGECRLAEDAVVVEGVRTEAEW